MPDFVDTGQEFTSAVATVKQLITLNQGPLELVDIFDYDEQVLPGTPCLSIVFERGQPIPKSLGRSCNSMEIDLNLFLYLESLELGQQTTEHLGRLCYLVNLLYLNPRLYGLCVSEGMTITDARFVGRGLRSDVYLVGQVTINLGVRFCAKDTP